MLQIEVPLKRIIMKRKFGKEQVVGYWTTSTNIVLVLTTFWLGLVVQDFVAERNANVSAVLTNVEYVKCVKPHVDSLNIQYNSFLHDIDSTLTYWYNTRDTILTYAGAGITFFSEYNEISWYYDDLLETSNKVMYYLDDAHVNTNIKGSMTVKIMALYGYKELLDFYFESDSVNPNKRKTVNDWPILEKRLIKLNQDPDYISLIGLNIKYDEVKDKYLSMYKGFFIKDSGELNAMALLTTIMESFHLALDIHDILNDNRFYVQKENKIITRILKAPWSILIIGILAIWIVFTIIVFKTAGNKNQSEDEINRRIKELEKALYKIDGRFDEIHTKLDCTKSKCERAKTIINETVDDIKRQLDEVKKQIGDTEQPASRNQFRDFDDKRQLDEVLKSASNPPKES